MNSKNLYKGSLNTIVLKLLEENDRMYGYEICQKVKELTQGQMSITEGALYPALHKLEADNLVTTETVNIGKRIRKYYSITPEGNKEAKNKLNELQQFIENMQQIVGLKTALS